MKTEGNDMTTSIRNWLSSGVRALLGVATWFSFLAIGLLPGRAAGGETGYYIGNSAHKLGDINNWKDGIRPGRFIDDGVTNGTFGGTMIFDDQAGWGVNLYTHNPAMVSVSNMLFRGASEKAFLIPDYATVWLEPGGRIEMEEGCEKTLSFGSSTYIKIRDVAQEGEYIDIVNNSSHPLSLGGVGNTQTSATQFRPQFRFSGSGDIVLSQNSATPNGWSADTQGSSPVFVFNQTGTFRHEGLYQTVLSSLVVPPSDTSRRIELVTKGFSIYETYQSSGITNAVTIGADTVITGPQGLSFGDERGTQSYIAVADGKTLTLDVHLLKTAYKNSSVKGIWFKGTGTTVFTSAVTNLAEQCYIENGATVKSPIVGAADSEVSPMGRGPCVSVANGGRFVYTGSGETTDRGIQIRYASDGYLEQGGTGPLVMSGNCVIANTGNSNLYLVNDTESEATYSGLLADNGSGKLAIRKTGSGLWRIDCAATYTGATAVNAGTLALGPSGSIGNSALTLGGGTLRIENADASFNSLTLAANTANALAVADGVSYTLPAFTRNNGASLDITLGTGSELTVTGIADGKAPSWLTIGGETGMIVNGKVKSTDDFTVAIDAKGGVIPDDSTAIVGITSAAGSGSHVSLENTITTVAAVTQSQSQDAVISLKNGETLNVSEIVVSEGAGDLTVDSTGSATISGPDSTAVGLNPAKETVLSLLGGLNVAAAELKGLGTVQLGADVDVGALTTVGAPALAVPSAT
jgi:autotransporter-associated beta strand protein